MKYFIVFSFIFLVGCSRNQMVLRFADTYVAYKINSEFEFQGAEKKEIRSIVAEIVGEFKTESLPVFAEFNGKLKAEFSGLQGSSAQIYLKWLKEKNSELGELFKKQSPVLEKRIDRFSKVVTERNWKAFQINFEEANLKMLKEGLKEKPESSRVLENIEDFWGELSQEQIAKVNEYMTRYPLNPELRVKNRRHQMKLFNEKIGDSFSSEKFSEVLRTWLGSPEAWSEPEYKKEIDQRRDDLLVLLSELLATSTPDQKKHIISVFEDLTRF